LQELVSEKCGEESELHEEVEKFKQNIDLYLEAVEDPKAMVESVEAAMIEEGEELEQDVDARTTALIARAMSSRNLTREEEEREQQKIAQVDEEDAAISNEKQWTNLSMLGVVFVALALLILTIQIVKKKGDAGQDLD